MRKEIKRVLVCTPDGWTIPSESSRKGGNTESALVAKFDEKCRIQVSKAEAVMKLIDNILNQEKFIARSHTISFIVNPEGFWWHDEKNIPKLIHQDPKLQIDI